MDRMRWANCLATIISRPHSILTLVDFFFWSCDKVKVYLRAIRDVEDLLDSITAAITTVTTVMLQRTWLELDYRLDILRAIKGAHVEVH
ncbi:hypothetical protein AVEN_116787-1 [Araneus ventricosus]|uniref:Uncharacterized protein n=1 Tax=Araneus ventricosus TaxID=182803 RepID=A0A4Y2D7X3_ARAVE|nr:hypothetical protein AVEN_116787-1 [Araneus ventricosus]